MKMKIIVLMGVVLQFTTAQVQAHLLPANFVLNKMVKDRATLKNIEIEGIITDVSGEQRFKEISKVDFLSGKMDTVFFTDSGEKIGEKTGKITALHPLGLAWFGVGFCSNGVKVKSFLEQLGITFPEGAEVRLKRIDARPVWEMGETSLLKIEKDQFWFAGFELNHFASFEVEKWTTVNGVHVPKNIRFKKDGKVKFNYELTTAKVNQTNLEMKATAIEHQNKPLTQEWIELVH